MGTATDTEFHRDLRAARTVLWSAANRRQTKLAFQVQTARTNLNGAIDAFDDGDLTEASRLTRVAHLQLVWALTMTSNFESCARIADAIVLLDRWTMR